VAQYQSYLLRVWRSSRPNGWQWAARLEGLQDGEHLRFADLDALLAHLRAARPRGPVRPRPSRVSQDIETQRLNVRPVPPRPARLI